MGNLDLKFYLSIFLRRLPYFVVIAAFLSAVGIAVASILPPIYRSTASILVESQQIPGDLAQSTVPINPIEQIQIIEQRMMTRANLLTLASRFGIYADQPKIAANDAKYREVFATQLQRLADDVCLRAEATAPKTLTDNHNLFAACLIFFVEKLSAED